MPPAASARVRLPRITRPLPRYRSTTASWKRATLSSRSGPPFRGTTSARGRRSAACCRRRPMTCAPAAPRSFSIRRDRSSTRRRGSRPSWAPPISSSFAWRTPRSSCRAGGPRRSAASSRRCRREMISKNISELAVAAALATLVAGCGGGRSAPPRSDVATLPPDAAVAARADTIARGDTTAASRADTTLATATDTTGAALSEPVLNSANLIMGYRIQIFASASLADAEALRDRLRREGVPAYVEYRSPLYRVRLWDCTDLAEARNLRERAVLMGYERATVVPTLVQADRVSRSAARAF